MKEWCLKMFWTCTTRVSQTFSSSNILNIGYLSLAILMLTDRGKYYKEKMIECGP